MLAKEKHKATYMAPVGIGLALFVAELVGVFFTGGSLSTSTSHPRSYSLRRILTLQQIRLAASDLASRPANSTPSTGSIG